MLDQGKIIRLQSMRQNLGQQRVAIVGRVRPRALRALPLVAKLVVKRTLRVRAGGQMLPQTKLIVVDEQFRIEHVQPLQLGKKIRRRVRYRTHRVVRIGLLPLREFTVCRAEIQVVHRAIARIEIGGGERETQRR